METDENSENVKYGKVGSLRGEIIKNVSALFGSATSSVLNITDVLSIPAIPTYVVNKFANRDNLISAISSLSDTIDENFTDLMLAASTWTVAAPMGVGTILSPTMLTYGLTGTVENALTSVTDTAVSAISSLLGFSTGGKVTRMATGGNILNDNRHRFKGITRAASGAVITGDAPGNNIFAGGARPELVTSDGDLAVTPLNTESSATKTKVSRMTAYERSHALATAISSHIIKFNRSFKNNEEEISNIGEAIKVYHVNNVFEDEITVGSQTTTMAELVGAIYTQLSALSTYGETNASILTSIASEISTVASLISTSSSSSSSNPYYGTFTSSLDGILSGG